VQLRRGRGGGGGLGMLHCCNHDHQRCCEVEAIAGVLGCRSGREGVGRGGALLRRSGHACALASLGLSRWVLPDRMSRGAPPRHLLSTCQTRTSSAKHLLGRWHLWMGGSSGCK
jgi:hypothetical protein